MSAPWLRAEDEGERRLWGLPLPAWLLAGTLVLVQLIFGPRYGLFRDEFYYLACADHLTWGYVDHPPLSIAVLKAVRALLGDSILAVRLTPALLGGVLVLLGGWLAQALGGGRFAQTLAALAVAATPQYLGQSGYYSLNSFDLVFWAAAALLVARLTPEGDSRRFLLLGLVLGLGLLNKISVLFFGAGLAVALVLTPLRRQLLRAGPWLAAAVAGLLFLPHVMWQVQHGWPTREFIENATRYKNVALSPLQFLGGQFLEINPVNAPLWIAGLIWLLVARRGRPFRALGIIYLTAFAIMAAQHSKPYYLGPAYPPLLAAGSVLVESLSWRWLRAVAVVLLLAGGAVLAPFGTPILPVETFIAYQKTLGVAPPQGERSRLGLLPQFFADRFGWQELTDAVMRAYRSLPPEDQRRVVIVTSNYGEAGALNYHGRRYGLPPAVSQHNSFYLWGPGVDAVDVVITVGMNPEDLRDSWDSVEVAGRFASPYAMPYEQRWPILVCRGLRLPLEDAWRRGKHFI
jgi:4-amino-4-deoxy-L-arabinose transferase-like glycosyltransferase